MGYKADKIAQVNSGDHCWVNYKLFISTMESFKEKSYSKESAREEMRDELDKLASKCPVTADSRFPDDLVVIDLKHSSPAHFLNHFRRLLGYGESQLNSGRLNFYTSLEALINIIGREPIENCHIFGVYTQSNFERQFGLEWV
jgi:hypothetical protein